MGAWFGEVVVHDPALGGRLPPGVRQAGLGDVVAASDVLSLHCPLTSATHHLVGADLLARMPLGSVLVNVARGALVDSHALAAALQRGRPRFAALDVLEQEPPSPGNPLVGNLRVLHTPHMAWYSTESVQRLRRLLASRCAEYLLGRPVSSVVSTRMSAFMSRFDE